VDLEADLNPAYRRLAIAMLLRAVRDARHGSGEALAWCYQDSPFGGRWWADLLDLECWPPTYRELWRGRWIAFRYYHDPERDINRGMRI